MFPMFALVTKNVSDDVAVERELMILNSSEKSGRCLASAGAFEQQRQAVAGA